MPDKSNPPLKRPGTKGNNPVPAAAEEGVREQPDSSAQACDQEGQVSDGEDRILIRGNNPIAPRMTDETRITTGNNPITPRLSGDDGERGNNPLPPPALPPDPTPGTGNNPLPPPPVEPPAPEQ